MTMLSLKISDFPQTAGFLKASWAPVLLRPILGSPEQYVIGVAAFTATDFHLERANHFDRLICFFAGNSATVEMIAQAGLDSLEEDLVARARDAIFNFEPTFSGISLGDVQEAEGKSLELIASSWMASLSSMYSAESEEELSSAASQLDGAEALTAPDKVRDRLPALVLDYVKIKRPDFDKFFSEEVRKPNSRRRTDASGVFIDFAGSKLVANFGTLNAQNAASINRIKRGLWDLKIDRDREPSIHKRAHEMLVQHPSFDDPQVTEKQWDKISGSLKSLEEQADQVEIRLRPLHSVKDIGEHLLEREAA